MTSLDLTNGYYDLPKGKLANVVTCLEMLQAVPQPAAAWPADVQLSRVRSGNLSAYRQVFRQVGQNLLWFSRLIMPDGELAGILGHSDVESFVLEQNGKAIGLLELNFRESPECELAFFGVVPEAVGGGFGKLLMAEAVTRAFARPIRRLWVHTCSYDHPRALPFYVKAGFMPYKLMIEIHDDPRRSGHLPLEAAPQVPLLTD